MGTEFFRRYAFVMMSVIFCAFGCRSNDTADIGSQSVRDGGEQAIGLSAHSVYMRIGIDTMVVTTRYGGWMIDSVRVYEDISGSRLLDKTFCLSEKDKKRMECDHAVKQRYGWLTIVTGKRMIRTIASRTLMANERKAVIYLHKGMYADSIRVEQEKDKFVVGGGKQNGN
ncbi:MAG: hypothetical protein Q4C43_09835 [Prevotella sp.]|nr:hypothetical protein [Prevotella sp.]